MGRDISSPQSGHSMQIESSPKRSPWPDVVGILFLFLTASLCLSGLRPLGNPDEGRYVEIAREMVSSGDWVTPRLNGVPYFYKPPLFYWLEASTIQVCGLDWTCLRFWPAFLGALGVVGIYLTGRKLYDRLTGLLAALITGTSILYFGIAQIIILDTAVSVFITLALCFFLCGREKPYPSRERRLLFYGYYLCLVLAVLSKGLIGLAIPAVIIGIWTVLCNRWREIPQWYLPSGILLFLVLATPWHVLAALANPAQHGTETLFTDEPAGQGFLWFYFIHEHFLRYLTTVSDRTKPFWYFFLLLPFGLIPWTVFLPQTIRDAWQKTHRDRSVLIFLWTWVLFVLLFFSISKSKLPPYILPVYPALGLLIGTYLRNALEKDESPGLKFGLIAFTVVALIGAAVFPILASIRAHRIEAQMFPYLILASLILTAGGIGCWYMLRKKRNRQAFAVMGVSMVIFTFLFHPLAYAFQHPTVYRLSQQLKPLLSEDIRVICVWDYFQELPVYLEREVGIAGHIPNEQSFGLALEDHSDRYIPIEEFNQLMRSETPVVAVMKHYMYPGMTLGKNRFRATALCWDGEFMAYANEAAMKRIREKAAP